MLCAVGDLVEDVVAHVDGPLQPGADAPARVGRHRGGSAANVAAVAARLTGRSRFIGAVGADALGERLLGALTALDVECRVTRRGRTGTIVVLVDEDGERTFVTDRGAAPSLGSIDQGLLNDVTVVHVPGYGLAQEPMASALQQLSATARGRGIPVAVDPSSTSLGVSLGIAGFRDALSALRPDVVLANRAEAAQLDLLDRPLAPLTVATAGAQSTLVLDGDDQVAVPVEPREVVDTTGAGDAFGAAFLISWVGGDSAEAAARAGHAAAARIVGGPGADWWEGAT